MSGALILTSRIPYPLHASGALRTFYLARELGRQLPCHLATFDMSSAQDDALLATGVFRGVTHLRLPDGAASLRRHLRWSNDNYWRSAYPTEFAGITRALAGLVEEHDIGVVVAMGIYIAEFLTGLTGSRRIVDDCDCQWLTKMRERQAAMRRPPVSARLAGAVQLHRTRLQESRLTSWADLVTTVSPVDYAALVQTTRQRPEAIRPLPNGVAPDLVDARPGEAECPNSVVFWGNLDFGPNQSAVRYFCREIFLPYLRGTGTAVYIVGPNPDPDLLALAESHPEIRVLGFVDDLFGLVSRMPIVVNPMVSGSGLKNKVLEAFALERAVVSTSLGMEAIDAEDGCHFLAADHPADFAAAILRLLRDPTERARLGANARALVLERYTWERVGRTWVQLVSDVVERREAYR
jgi:glycosyltransferase involved in cell wall biosynthesis